MITVADAILHALDHAQPMAPITDSDPDFDLPRAYAAQAELTARRKARGAHVIGLKAGFTNTTIWPEYGIDAPIHGPVFDTTLGQSPLAVAAFPEAKIEPEVAFRLRATPQPGMEDAALLACVEAVAPAFEIVQSPFPGWRAKAPDTVAAGAMHAALVLGEWQPTRPDWLGPLHNFTATLLLGDDLADRGTAANLLGSGPLAVLRHLAGLGAPMPADAIVSTGTVTRALPALPGQTWTARFDGIALPPLTLALT